MRLQRHENAKKYAWQGGVKKKTVLSRASGPSWACHMSKIA